jgi:hypothetical protein
MSDGLASVEPDGPLYRLGRYPDPWAWPDWSYAAPDGTFGNRYDDPEASYRVLYASSQRVGAFLETLARFRPDLEVLAELEEIEGEEEPPPAMPRSWLDNRLLGEATVGGRFVEVGDTTSLATLRTALAASAIRYGLDEIDAATIRREHRARSLSSCRGSCTSTARTKERSQGSATGRDSATTCSTGRSSNRGPMRRVRSSPRQRPRSQRTTRT